jgi:hypothetical protein
MADRLNQCTQRINYSEIKLEEYGRIFILLNPERQEVLCVKIDQCLIRDGIRADWCIMVPNQPPVIIELKGRDIIHACRQIEITIETLINHYKFHQRFCAIIVCSQFPKVLTKFQIYQQRFTRRWGGRLRAISRRRVEMSMRELF